MSSTQLVRSKKDRMLAGVCGGLGVYFDIDPTLFRIIFVALVIFGGAGLLLYIILWIIMPEEGASPVQGEERVKQFGKEVEERVAHLSKDITAHPDNKKRMVLAAALIIIGGAFLANNYLPSVNIWRLWPFFVILLGAWLLWQSQPKTELPSKAEPKAEEKKLDDGIGERKEKKDDQQS